MQHALAHSRKGQRSGIGIIIVVMVVVILLIVGVGIYFLAAGSSKTTTNTTQLPIIQGNTMLPATTSTIASIQTTSTTVSVHSVSASSSVGGGSTSGSSGITTYSGTFNFSLPLGPSGDRDLSNGTLQMYNTTQVGSGSFTFFIAAQNKSGSGSGHGTLTVTTAGFCSGSSTFPYTFTIPDATTILGNYTVFFGNPVPGNFTVQLSCTGDMSGVNTSTNNPSSFLPVYPNEINFASMPVTANEHQTGDISYYYNVVQTG